MWPSRFPWKLVVAIGKEVTASMYSPEIMSIIRQNLGLMSNDSTYDKNILGMPIDEIKERILEFYGFY